ncbi:unnamed protein product [Caenorhabditis nigoni]
MRVEQPPAAVEALHNLDYCHRDIHSGNVTIKRETNGIKCDDCGQWFHVFCLYLVNNKSGLPDDFSFCGFQEALDGLGGVGDLPNLKPQPRK